MITVLSVPFDDERAQALWAEQQAEIAERYGEDDEGHAPLTSDGVAVSLLALEEDGTPVGTVLARWSHYHPDEPGAIEVKRLYVIPSRRDRGYGRVLMGAYEKACERVGATRIVLETGTAQPEAVSLYERIGYARAAEYGPYVGESELICMTKALPTRVLVINGTMGAGKTSTAYAAVGLLGAAGARVAMIDADALTDAEPTPPGDRFQQGLMFQGLAALAPIYRARGYGLVVIARVIEDAEDRDRYARAFASDAGLAPVSVVRVTASASTRAARLVAREPEGYWQEFSLARTEELEDSLDSLDLDDAIVSTEDISRDDAARAVLDAAGWWVPGEPIV